MSGKQVFVIGLLLFGPAFVMFKLGQQEIRYAAEFEANPELLEQRLEPGETPPTRSDGIIHYCWSALWATLGTGCILYTIFVHLDVLGRRKPATFATHNLREVTREKWKANLVSQLEARAAAFVELGFQSVGYVEEDQGGAVYRRALYLSTDRTNLLTVSTRGDKVTASVMAITANGIYLSVDDNRKAFTMDGLERGMPFLIRTYPTITTADMLAELNELPGLTLNDVTLNPLVAIDAAHASAMLRYRTLLVNWYAFLGGHSHQTPASELPEIKELFQVCAGEQTFCWGAGSMSHEPVLA